MFFVNLPLRYILDDNRFLELLLAHTAPAPGDGGSDTTQKLKLGPELGLDARVLEQKTVWFEELAKKLRSRSVCCTVHLPFIDIRPGSPDKYIREASAKRLNMALERALLFGPKRLIAHPHYFSNINGNDSESWLKASVDIWSALIEKLPPDAVLCLENTHETAPDQLVALAAELDPEKSGICFDIGHWFSFAGGCEKQNFGFWLETLAPYLKHLHLHDNDGSMDQHKGLGQGNIPVEQIFDTLRELGLTPSATLEPHCEESFMQSLAYLQAHPALLESVATPGGCRE